MFSSRHFLHKTNERIIPYYYETSGRLVFVRFLEEIDNPKNPFEINWPLEAEATLLTNDPLARWGDVSLGRSRTTKTCTDPDSWVCGRGMTDWLSKRILDYWKSAHQAKTKLLTAAAAAAARDFAPSSAVKRYFLGGCRIVHIVKNEPNLFKNVFCL